MLGFGQAVIFVIANGKFERKVKEGQAQPGRQPIKTTIDHIGRLTENELGHNVLPAPHGYGGERRNARSLHGDITTGVARTNDEHALACKWRGAFVLMRVDEFTCELAFIFRVTRIPMMSIRDE